MSEALQITLGYILVATVVAAALAARATRCERGVGSAGGCWCRTDRAVHMALRSSQPQSSLRTMRTSGMPSTVTYVTSCVRVRLRVVRSL